MILETKDEWEDEEERRNRRRYVGGYRREVWGRKNRRGKRRVRGWRRKRSYPGPEQCSLARVFMNEFVDSC
jgi:hypothetical protein